MAITKTKDEGSEHSQSDQEHGHIELSSADNPNIPMNWPKWQKYATYGTICIYTFICTANVSNLSVAVVTLEKYFQVSAARASYIICFTTLTLGFGNLLWVPLARIIGKRPLFLIAPLLLVAFNVWSYKTTSFGSLVAARICSGFAAAAGDAPVPALVADLFPVTERGFAMMFFQLSLSCGFFIGPVINAYIVQNTGGWQWCCGWIAVASAFNWILIVFFVWETNVPQAQREKIQPRHSWLSRMSVTKGYDKDGSFWRALKDIVILALYPPITWAGILTGALVGWNIIVQLVSASTFPAPPYLWQIHSIGLLALSGFVGTILAIFVGGRLIDYTANRMTRHNGGVRKPEYRLISLILPSIVGPMGLVVFGCTIAAKMHWIAPAVGYSMQGFGLTASSNVLATYAVDSAHEVAGEALVYFFIIRAIIACLLSLFAFDWITATGLRNCFGEMAGISYFLLMFSFLFYFKGESIRRWAATSGPLKSRREAVAIETVV